jgi:hypothetical protein
VLDLIERKHLQHASLRLASLSKDLAQLSMEASKDLPRLLEAKARGVGTPPARALEPALALLGSIERRLRWFGDLAASYDRWGGGQARKGRILCLVLRRVRRFGTGNGSCRQPARVLAPL